MPFLAAVSSVLSHTLKFRTRASRSEYWWWQLFAFLVAFVAQVVVGSQSGGSAGQGAGGIVWIVLLLPSLSVAWRRMHDAGRGGWWTFVPIANIVFTFVPSVQEVNRWGPPPPPRAV